MCGFRENLRIIEYILIDHIAIKLYDKMTWEPKNNQKRTYKSKNHFQKFIVPLQKFVLNFLSTANVGYR